ncbi:uncharacterized protein LOC141689212 [Apium graveolens]|uniref:uncharacterized protein LOC141689212 n=1 Tax=Apium graveolens TaxID=4045 RepID=UPI003D7B335F
MFELPASRIVPNNNPNLSMNDPVHCCANLRSLSKLHTKDKKAQIDTRKTENSTMAKKRERRNTVSVIIPETEDIGVPLPDHWFPRNEEGTSTSRGNLMDAFNDASDVPLDDMSEYEQYMMNLMQYPLLFPYSDDGFHLNIPLKSKKQNMPAEPVNDQHPDETRHRITVTMREYYAYKLIIHPDKGMNLYIGGRLWKKFVVDAFAAVEHYRLDCIRNHQSNIRSDFYRFIHDSLAKGDTNPRKIGKNVILPATHTGSQRYMNQYFKDFLAICRTIGHPSLFLTMKCNTQWPEIKQMMEYLLGVDVANKPDVIAIVFKLKLDQLLDLIKKKNYFGKCIGVLHVIEFQKHGLPHRHMLIWLHLQSRPQNMQQIDELISSEILDKNMDHIGYNVVQAYMIHETCGKDFSYSPCMVKGNHGRHFPKKYNANTFFDDCGFPVYRRRRTEESVLKKGVLLENQYIVSYNRDLLLRFHCHINLEKIKDIPEKSTTKEKSIDEIINFLDGRYICASEAAWRLLGFDIHHHFPSVELLPVHMEDDKNVSFKPHHDL